MFEELTESYNSVVTAFNELSSAMQVTADQMNFIVGAIKIGGLIVFILFIVLVAVIFAMNTKINVLRKQNDEIIEQFKLTILFLKRGKIKDE